MNISRQTASKWWNRYRVSGPSGLGDRPWWPHTNPAQTRSRPPRRGAVPVPQAWAGPTRPIVGLPLPTVHRVLVCHGCRGHSYMDHPTGRAVRQSETDHPGELVHLDVKKLAKIPPGGTGGRLRLVAPPQPSSAPHRHRRPTHRGVPNAVGYHS
jgi:hypothetical protein